MHKLNICCVTVMYVYDRYVYVFEQKQMKILKKKETKKKETKKKETKKK